MYTRGTCRYLEHDLSAVLYLAHVGPVLVQPHVADQQDLAVLDEAGEGAVHWDTAGQYSTAQYSTLQYRQYTGAQQVSIV